MRLIDADALLTNMDKGMQGTAREYLKFYQMAVNDEPTAYDVDKVVERLEVNSMFVQTDDEDMIDDEAFVTLEDAIKIIGSGGIQYPDSAHTDTENVTADWKEHLAGRFNRFE